MVLNKKETLERCIRQIHEYYSHTTDESLAEDHLYQDAIVVNIERACEACIDLANHTVRVFKLGLPKESRESFELLYKNKVIDKTLCARMQAMVGFRNVALHEYQTLDVSILMSVIKNELEGALFF